MTPLAQAQATLEATAEYVAKRMVMLGLDHRLRTALIDAVAACRAARRVGELPPASTLAQPLEGRELEPAPEVPSGAPQSPHVSTLRNNPRIVRQNEIDGVVRTALLARGDQPTLYETLVVTCASSPLMRGRYRSTESQRAAIRESIRRLRTWGDLVHVKQGRFLAVLPTPQLLGKQARVGVS